MLILLLAADLVGRTLSPRRLDLVIIFELIFYASLFDCLLPSPPPPTVAGVVALFLSVSVIHSCLIFISPRRASERAVKYRRTRPTPLHDQPEQSSSCHTKHRADHFVVFREIFDDEKLWRCKIQHATSHHDQCVSFSIFQSSCRLTTFIHFHSRLIDV